MESPVQNYKVQSLTILVKQNKGWGHCRFLIQSESGLDDMAFISQNIRRSQTNILEAHNNGNIVHVNWVAWTS